MGFLLITVVKSENHCTNTHSSPLVNHTTTPPGSLAYSFEVSCPQALQRWPSSVREMQQFFQGLRYHDQVQWHLENSLRLGCISSLLPSFLLNENRKIEHHLFFLFFFFNC